MAGPGPSTGYSPAAGAESIYSKDTSPLTVSTDSGPVVPTPLPSKMQRVSDVSGRIKAVASLSVKEKGISRAPSSVGESRGNAGPAIRKDEEGGNTDTTIRKDEGVDPETAPTPISDDDNNV